MKIRIKGNSIRLRLTQTEVANFARFGKLEERTEFGDTFLAYELLRNEAVKTLSATMHGNKITMHVPLSMANEWTTTEVVGFQDNQPLPGGKQLFLLLEKDFVCLDNTFEDQSDNYPNPNAHC